MRRLHDARLSVRVRDKACEDDEEEDRAAVEDISGSGLCEKFHTVPPWFPVEPENTGGAGPTLMRIN
jgi:hypothetical protein